MNILAHTIITIFLIGTAQAKWGHIPPANLLKKTDLVVVAKLSEINEFTKNDVDYGEGILVVSEVIHGEVKAGVRLKLEWSNLSKITCPRINHTQHDSVEMIWLLTVSEAGSVFANHPCRIISLDRRPEVEKAIEHIDTQQDGGGQPATRSESK